MPLDDLNLPRWVSDDPINAVDLNSISNTLLDLKRYVGGSAKEGQKRQTIDGGFTVKDIFPAIIRSSPCGSGGGDYTDARYYVDRGLTTSGATAVYAATKDLMPGAKSCMTATNLAEVAASSHELSAGTLVLCFALLKRSNPVVRVNVFVQPPPGIRTPVETLTGTGATANSVTWDRDSDTEVPDVEVATREFWDSASNTLYGFKRTLSFDSIGTIYHITAETRYTIFTGNPDC